MDDNAEDPRPAVAATIRHSLLRLDIFIDPKNLFVYHVGVKEIVIGAPAFEIDGEVITCGLRSLHLQAQRRLPHGVDEYEYHGVLQANDELSLRMFFRLAADNPIIRFRYELASSTPRKLTKANGVDRLTYCAFSMGDLPRVKEVRFSEFRDPVHAYCLSERELDDAEFDASLSAMGPMLVGADDTLAMLVAYEHGSQAPDAFVQFNLHADRGIDLSAVKGNYWAGQPLEGERVFQSIWFNLGGIVGNEEALAQAYRTFVLKYMSPNVASRRPYIFYNTWNFQERNKHIHGRPYLESMTEARILAEIDVAHGMGIDVFVLDTGWYEKTGDWRVSSTRFKNGLKAVKEKLDGYGMRLGLWFDNAAALSSQILADHKSSVISWQGKQAEPQSIWETEPAHRMCLVSEYADAFADELIRLAREVGVRYFKWDAIGQYGCDSPHHLHGSAEVPEKDRADCYAFQQVRSMTRIVDKLCSAVPEAIVDFDITERGRSVGLAFLAAGKFFLINNGPYYQNYDVPLPPPGNWNLFFWPGPARAWICRTPLPFDKWIPSVLFLTHYLPDDPAENQMLSIASLILGQNGIWGDLPTISADGVQRFGQWLGIYKTLRDDITESALIRTGDVGGDPEIYEKISDATGRGVVVIFASSHGTYHYITKKKVAHPFTATGGTTVKPALDGRSHITVTFPRDDRSPGLVFFGTSAGGP